MSIIQIVQAVQAVEARKLIPKDTPSAITYFSHSDSWIFTAVYDNVVCADCLMYEHEEFWGDTLRGLFPYLEIQDLETILPKVHPNCRCRLERVLYMGDIGTEQ